MVDINNVATRLLRSCSVFVSNMLKARRAAACMCLERVPPFLVRFACLTTVLPECSAQGKGLSSFGLGVEEGLGCRWGLRGGRRVSAPHCFLALEGVQIGDSITQRYPGRVNTSLRSACGVRQV